MKKILPILLSLLMVMAPALASEAASGETLAPVETSASFDHAVATHTLHDQEGNNYDAANAVDGNLATCWAYPQMNDTVTLTLSSDGMREVYGIRLTPGYAKSKYAFTSNNRVAAFVVRTPGGSDEFAFTLDEMDADDFGAMVELTFPESIITDVLIIEVTDVYPGTHFTDTCISEIELF